MLQEFEGHVPHVPAGSWAHESAVLIGDVVLEEGVSIWPTVVLRGDMGPIRIGRDSNIQDGTICHDTTGFSVTTVGCRVTVGHRVILHGCSVGDDCLIGMGAIVMDGVVIGANSFIAAGTLIPPGKIIPEGSMVMGSPGRVKGPVGPRDLEQIAHGWTNYRDRLQVWLARGR